LIACASRSVHQFQRGADVKQDGDWHSLDAEEEAWLFCGALTILSSEELIDPQPKVLLGACLRGGKDADVGPRQSVASEVS
jgi:hypothetical protein